MPLPKKSAIPSILLFLVAVAIAAPPIWWQDGDPPVIDPAADPQNLGVANIGQAKHMVKSALTALEAARPEIAAEVSADLANILDLTVPDPKTAEWTEKQKAPLLIGQLKAISAPFYSHLNEAEADWLTAERTANGTNHADSIFPWTAELTDDSNKALANIGQLKAVFSLRFESLPTLPEEPIDSDGDGLPDEWELAYFGNLGQTGSGDFDNDGISNLDEYQASSNPMEAPSNGGGENGGGTPSGNSTPPELCYRAIESSVSSDTVFESEDLYFYEVIVHSLSLVEKYESLVDSNAVIGSSDHPFNDNRSDNPAEFTLAGYSLWDENLTWFTTSMMYLEWGFSDTLLAQFADEVDGSFSIPEAAENEDYTKWLPVPSSLSEMRAGSYHLSSEEDPTEFYSTKTLYQFCIRNVAPEPVERTFRRTFLRVTKTVGLTPAGDPGTGLGDTLAISADSATSDAGGPEIKVDPIHIDFVVKEYATHSEVVNVGLTSEELALHDQIPRHSSNSSDAGKSVDVSLLPVEVRVRQDAGHTGPHGSAAMYSTPRPQNGRAQDELFSLWENEEAFVTIGGALGDLIDAGNLPADFVKWSTPGLAPTTNQKEYHVEWSTPGLKEVKLEIGSEEFKVRINLPDTGSWRLDDDALKNHVGLVNYGICGALGVKARNNVQLLSGQDPETGDTKQDAIRHSTWNLLSAAAIGKSKTIDVTTANEHTGRLDQSAFSSNTTMDLFNNDRGGTEGAAVYVPGGTQVDTLAAIKHMRLIFEAGELRAWTPPNNNVNNHHHFLKNSDQTAIFAP